MRRAILRSVALAALFGFAGVPLAGAADPGTDAAVLAAAFRQQIHEHLDASARAAGTVICLAVRRDGTSQDPGREILARFAGEKAVRRATACVAHGKGAVEAATSKPAVIVTAGPIDWVASDEAWVTVSYFRSARSSALRRYRVVREPKGWVSLGPILRDGPA